MIKQFRSEGSHSGRKWAALTDKWRKRKQRIQGRSVKSGSGKGTARSMLILQLTQALYDSLTVARHEEHIADFEMKGPQHIILRVGSKNEKLPWHAGKGMKGSNHNPLLPVRDPLRTSRKQRDEYKDAAWEWLKKHKTERVLKALAAHKIRLTVKLR
jgi:hypothetical protein